MSLGLSLSQRFAQIQLILPVLRANGNRMRLQDLAAACKMTPAEVKDAVIALSMVHTTPDLDSYIDVFVEGDWVDLGPQLDLELGHRPLPLNVAEVAALTALVRVMADGPLDDLARDASAVLEKVTKLASPVVQAALKHMSLFIDTGVGVISPTWAVLSKAIDSDVEVVIEYLAASNDELSKRTVQPLKLYGRDGYWYVMGHCKTRQDRRHFRLDRVVSVELTDKKFVSHDVPDESDFTEDDGQETILVHIDKDAANWAIERNPDASIKQLPDGSIEIELSRRLSPYLAGWILSFSGKAQVIKPKSMRRVIADRLAAAFDL